MRKAIFSIVILFAFQLSKAQHLYEFDANAKTLSASLRDSLVLEKDDYKRYFLLDNICNACIFVAPDSCFAFVQQELALANRMKSDTLLSHANVLAGYMYFTLGNYPKALAHYQEALKAAEHAHYFLSESISYFNLANFYLDQDDLSHALSYSKRAKSLIESHWKPSFGVQGSTYDQVHDTLLNYLLALESLGQAYEKSGTTDSAIAYYRLLINGYLESRHGKMDWSIIPFYEGNINTEEGDYRHAIKDYQQGVALAASKNINKDLVKNYYGLTKAYMKIGAFDSSIACAKKVIEISKYAHNPIFELNALYILNDIYKSRNNIDSLAKYLQLTIATRDSLFSQQKSVQVQDMTLRQQELDQQLVQANLAYKSRLNIYFLLAGLAISLIVAGGLWKRNVYKQKSYTLLKKQKLETDSQKAKVEKALEELRMTQAQLIQSEKMASLGEITAGIAHEIQNPLNFVNNFSEVNTELLTEMKTEMDKGNLDEAKGIANDVIDNQQKILNHGRRADKIVKGMLLHSRTSNGKKELTDINALCDEYLRFSFHGLRAKDKSFDAKFETDFDFSIEKINILPMEVGKVILNLVNNAFYAVTEKQKQNLELYYPKIIVTTRKLADKVSISVADNGNGIPPKIMAKIFQPFFTTKPTGQGTGLGLSLSYDIIKAHGGDIKVESKEGEGSAFTVTLPG